MADGFHVSGTCLVYSGTGPGNALELVGYSDAGVDVQITHNVKEIFTDLFGPMTPHEFQDLGEVAVISVPFIVSYREILKKIQNRGDKSTQGWLNSPGYLLGSSGASFKIGLTAPADEPYLFYNCLWRPDSRVKLGTVAAPFTAQFFAWPFLPYTAVSGRNAPLYARSLS